MRSTIQLGSIWKLSETPQWKVEAEARNALKTHNNFFPSISDCEMNARSGLIAY